MSMKYFGLGSRLGRNFQRFDRSWFGRRGLFDKNQATDKNTTNDHPQNADVKRGDGWLESELNLVIPRRHLHPTHDEIAQ